MDISEIFPDRSEASLRLARNWLLLGLFALIAAGLFSVLLVLSRTPAIQEMIPLIDFFHIALVVHVNLSVLIWFMSFACVLWTLTAKDMFMPLAQLSFYLALAGTVLLAICPFLGAGDPVMNNYIPTLKHDLFFAALILFAAGVCLRLVLNLIATPLQFSEMKFSSAIGISTWLAASVCILAVWALYQSYIETRHLPLGDVFYEFLYWGSGHILQFNHSLLMLLVWLILIVHANEQLKPNPSLIVFLSFLVLFPVLDSLRIYAFNDVYSGDHRVSFTQLMKFGGLTTIPFAIYLAFLFFKSTSALKSRSLNRAILLCSVLLFLTGGVIGFMIEGVNVVIPAHYHGSIVGVTLAFMGLAYLLMPVFGYAPVRLKLAKAQMYTYAAGQMMHIIGLAWSGGYGVQRKTAGAAQGLESLEQIAGMGLMGAGGGISVIAGVLFMVAMILSIRDSR